MGRVLDCVRVDRKGKLRTSIPVFNTPLLSDVDVTSGFDFLTS